MGRSLINQYGQQTDWTCSERALCFIDTMCGELESKILHVIEHCVPISVQKTQSPIGKRLEKLETPSCSKGKGHCMA